MGPGTYEWTTRVLAQFWDQGEDTLIAPGWIDAAYERAQEEPYSAWDNTRALGIDLAPYGTAENVVAARVGETLVEVRAFPSGRTDHLIIGDPLNIPEGWSVDPQAPLPQMVQRYRPSYLIYDADGVGAGTIGEWDRLHRWARVNGYMGENSQVIGFRGGMKIVPHYLNQRAGWWWSLRRRFERNRIRLIQKDRKTYTQLTQLTYSINGAGAIRVETKDEMRRRGLESPDRADAVMYAFAFSEDLPDPSALPPGEHSVVEAGYATDNSEAALWRRMQDLRRKPQEVNAVTGIPDEL
jgi:hypothetical protein